MGGRKAAENDRQFSVARCVRIMPYPRAAKTNNARESAAISPSEWPLDLSASAFSMPKFLHTADWQIGRQFSTFDPEDAHPLADARLTAVERLAALAVLHQVDAVLVAGDVFDAQTVTDRTILRMFNAMTAFNGPWVLISGNHDAALAEGVWPRAQRLGAVPANVHLALSAVPVQLPDCQAVVLPAPLTQRHTYDDATAWFDEAASPDGWLRIGLAHGGVQGILAEGVAATNPVAAGRAALARLDYLALGDWHGSKRIDARTWYSGTPEPDRFKSNAAGQALLVEIAGAGAEPVVTPLPTAQFDWQTRAVSLRVATDLDELQAVLNGFAAHIVLDLQLDGQLALAEHQRLMAALAMTRARLRHLSVDMTALRLAPTADDIASLQAEGYLAEVMAELHAEQVGAGDAAEIARAALAILATTLAEAHA